MLNIPGHKGNANQNNIEISPPFSQNDYHQEHEQQQMLAKILEKEDPFLNDYFSNRVSHLCLVQPGLGPSIYTCV
jgi:hypothetical protein